MLCAYANVAVTEPVADFSNHSLYRISIRLPEDIRKSDLRKASSVAQDHSSLVEPRWRQASRTSKTTYFKQISATVITERFAAWFTPSFLKRDKTKQQSTAYPMRLPHLMEG